MSILYVVHEHAACNVVGYVYMNIALHQFYFIMILVRKNGSAKRRKMTVTQQLVSQNVFSAFRDESYAIIVKCVEEAMKDPELREKLEYHTRQMLKAIAEKL